MSEQRRVKAPFVLITGTSRGIGQAVAEALLDRGCEVLGVARGEAPAALTAHERYSHVVCDLSDVEAVRRTLATEPLRGSLAGRDRVALVNNAALLGLAPVAATELDTLVRGAVLNLAVPLYLHGLMLRLTEPGCRLRIIDISSGAAQNPYPAWSLYCATKAGLDMAGAVLGAECAEVADLGDRDIAVVSFAPGVVATAMQEQLRASDAKSFPRRARFVALHEDGALLPAAVPAREIAALVFDDGLPAFSRRRCQGSS